MAKADLQFNFLAFLKGLWLLKEKPLRYGTKKFILAFWKYYLRIQYSNLGKPIVVSLPIDKKIPSIPSAIKTYNSYLPVFGGCAYWASREFGKRSLQDIGKFFEGLNEYYKDAAIIFKNAPTTCGRSGYGGILTGIIRLFDRDLNAAPSLHVVLVASWYMNFTEMINTYANSSTSYDGIKQKIFNQTVKIIESTLLTKQHCVMDIALAFTFLSCRDRNFTQERAKKFTYALFSQFDYRMGKQTVAEIQSAILDIYSQTLALCEASGDKKGLNIIIPFLQGLRTT